MKYTGTSGDLIESRKSIATANAPNTAIHAKKKTMPRINLNDGQHQLIVARDGERVLTPQQNETWESTHPNARKEPLKASLYDAGGEVAMPNDYAARGSQLSTAAQSLDPKVGTTGQKLIHGLEAYGKSGRGSHLADSYLDDSSEMIPVEQPVSYFDGGGRVGSVTTNPEQLIKQGKALHEDVENPIKEKQANIDAYRRSTEPQSQQSALPRIYETSSKDLIHPASKYGSRSGEKRLDSEGNEVNPRTPEGMSAAGVRKPYLPMLPVYDTGGTVETEEAPGQRELDKEQIQPSADAARQAPSTPLGYVGKYEPAPAPAQAELDRAQIKEVHQKADDLQDTGLKTNNISQVGLGQIYHNLADKRMPSYLPKVEAPAATPEPTAPTGIGSTGAAPSGQLIQTKPEMPAYIGQERIGKGTPGEKQLISDRQTDVDHLKYVMAHGTREEAANAEEQLARLEKGTPWGSPSNHPGLLGKIGHIASEVGQAALIPTAPYMLNAIPGTQARLAGQEAQGIGKIKELGQERLTAAETTEKAAAAKAAGAKTPPEQVMHDLLAGNNGQPRVNPDTNQPYTASEAYQKVQEIAKPTDETKQPVGTEGVTRHNAILTGLTKGMSSQEAADFNAAYSVKNDDTLAVQTKRAEDARATAALSGAERDRKLARDQQEKNHQEVMAATAANRAANESNKDKASAMKERQEVAKIYADPLQSSERYNIMTSNLEKALPESEGGKNDQQAQLSLLANHLGMTMGLQKGARLTKDIINEAAKSQPWVAGIKAKFDKDGYLSGLTLGPDQMKSMVDLARERYREDVMKARSLGKYAGAEDDGPDRTPSTSTMHYYLKLSGGDVSKAKQLADEDGWTVKK